MMLNVFRILKGVIALAIVAFLVMVVVGVYTALDSATAGYGWPEQTSVSEVQAEG